MTWLILACWCLLGHDEYQVRDSAECVLSYYADSVVTRQQLAQESDPERHLRLVRIHRRVTIRDMDELMRGRQWPQDWYLPWFYNRNWETEETKAKFLLFPEFYQCEQTRVQDPHDSQSWWYCMPTDQERQSRVRTAMIEYVLRTNNWNRVRSILGVDK